MKVTSRARAWQEADRIFPTDYELDFGSTKNSGYNVYRSRINYYDYICDLGDRLEINLSTGGTVNIWIEEPDFTESEKCELIGYIDKFLYDLEDKLGYGMTSDKTVCFKKYGLGQIGDILNAAYDKLGGNRT